MFFERHRIEENLSKGKVQKVNVPPKTLGCDVMGMISWRIKKQQKPGNKIAITLDTTDTEYELQYVHLIWIVVLSNDIIEQMKRNCNGLIEQIVLKIPLPQIRIRSKCHFFLFSIIEQHDFPIYLRR